MVGKTDAGVVAGVFAEEEQATEAVQKLIEAHYDPDHEIDVVASHQRQHEHVPIWRKFRFGRNASIGAAVGAVVAGAGVAIAGLTTGPFTMVAAGPFFAALEGTLAGAGVGFAAGSLLSLQRTHPAPQFDVADVDDGVVWVGVQAEGERGERARDILATAGARHFTS